MQNERLAVQQKLSEAYRTHLALAQERLAEFWRNQGQELDRLAATTKASAFFAQCVRNGLADSVIRLGTDGRPKYDGCEGLDALLSNPPDTVILDPMLPKVNGHEICRLARARHLDMPNIMLTAKGQEDDIVRGLELGADDLSF
ncbi:MAG: response regulator [Verrucomicrobia bacterium]|nr:response regulator [Verrucomicrobiota bacterium]